MGLDHLTGRLQPSAAQRSTTGLDQFVHIRIHVSAQFVSPAGRRRAFGCGAKWSLCHLSAGSLAEFTQVRVSSLLNGINRMYLITPNRFLLLRQVVLHVRHDRQGGVHRRGAVQTRLHSVLRSWATEDHGLNQHVLFVDLF